MGYRRTMVDIFRDLVASMTFPVTIDSQSASGNTWTLIVCDLYHAEVGRTVTIGGNDYVIASIDSDTNTMVVTGADPIVVTTFNLYLPFYFHGTPIATDDELVKENEANSKTPMIWLLETFGEEREQDPLSMHDRYFTGKLFFLTQADHEKWLTDEAYIKAIEPMDRLAQTFITYIESNPGDFDLPTLKYKIDSYAKFGVYITNKGMEKNMFADKLSGVGISFSPLTLQKGGICDTPCTPNLPAIPDMEIESTFVIS